MFFDPIYLLFIAPGLLLALCASFRVRHAFARYSQVSAELGYSGAEAAERLLALSGIRDVRVVPTDGYLSDHYNPLTKELAPMRTEAIMAHSLGHVAGRGLFHELQCQLPQRIGRGKHLPKAQVLWSTDYNGRSGNRW
jgi:Zn-dependent membrane protease YugP